MSDRNAALASSLIERVRDWASLRGDVRGLALVGSYARGEAGPDSDVDFVVLCSERSLYVADSEWVSTFGEVARVSLEDWGKVQSVRVLYENGLEVEFGIAGLDWAATPPDSGTAAVLKSGIKILFDRDGLIARMVHNVRGSA
jgi:uncharacterized protein